MDIATRRLSQQPMNDSSHHQADIINDSETNTMINPTNISPQTLSPRPDGSTKLSVEGALPSPSIHSVDQLPSPSSVSLRSTQMQ